MKSLDEIKQYLEYVLFGKTGTKAISQTSTSAYLWPFVEEVEKAVKALEIIKEKQINFLVFNVSVITKEGVRKYNSHFASENQRLTQEEFDLLKEVLK